MWGSSGWFRLFTGSSDLTWHVRGSCDPNGWCGWWWWWWDIINVKVSWINSNSSCCFLFSLVLGCVQTFLVFILVPSEAGFSWHGQWWWWGRPLNAEWCPGAVGSQGSVLWLCYVVFCLVVLSPSMLLMSLFILQGLMKLLLLGFQRILSWCCRSRALGFLFIVFLKGFSINRILTSLPGSAGGGAKFGAFMFNCVNAIQHASGSFWPMAWHVWSLQQLEAQVSCFNLSFKF